MTSWRGIQDRLKLNSAVVLSPLSQPLSTLTEFVSSGECHWPPISRGWMALL